MTAMLQEAGQPAADRPRPTSKTDLFFSFSVLALQGFGGVVAVVQRELVEKKRWLTQEEFVEEWAVAQVMPGPNVINLAITIGARYFGGAGALAAIAGMLAFPTLVVVVLALLYAEFASVPQVAGAVRGMGAVAAGLITAAGLKLVPALKRHPMGLPVCLAFMALAFVCVAWLKLPLLWVLLGLGGTGMVLTWRKLA